MTAGKYAASGFANTGTAGYAAGGDLSGYVRNDTVDTFAFPSDSRSLLAEGLSVAVRYAASGANELSIP